jgi:hypothetical protein
MSGAMKLASVLKKAADGDLTGEQALQIVHSESFEGVDWQAKLFAQAYHLLQHFAADEDIRSKEPGYAARQARSLRRLAQKLADGAT